MNHLSLSDKLNWKLIKFSSTKFSFVVPLLPNSTVVLTFENKPPAGIPSPNDMPNSFMDSLLMTNPVFTE